VDDRHKPTQCVLRTDAALTYFSDRTNQAFLHEAVYRFSIAGDVWLVWPHQSELEPPTEPAEVVERLEFYDYDPDSEILDCLRKKLPTKYDIQPIDAELFLRCEWREEMEFYAGSFDNFLKQDLGLCILHDDEIIVEAYASALGVTKAEIGAITRQPYRGKGYAPIACAHLIDACEQRGYQAYWSCDADHIASIRVAQKLGFQDERAYQIFAYES
jgi:RimJ/RimL family protein N-acetyltransferase